MSIYLNSCRMCKFLKGHFGASCEAFPEGIPMEIFTGEHDHTEPFKGDKGIRFEPIEDNRKA